jgi:Tfp pilus assembly protein PilO
MAEGKRRKIDRRQMMPLIIGGAMVAAFALLVYVPKSAHLSRQRQALNDTRLQLAELSQRAAGAAAVRAEIENLLDTHQLNKQRVPREARVPEFLHEVSAVLADEETTRRELIPGAARSQGDYEELPITITFESSFAGAFRTLSRIEQLTRLSRVDSVKMTSAAGGTGLVRVELKLVIFQLASPQGTARGKAST